MGLSLRHARLGRRRALCGELRRLALRLRRDGGADAGRHGRRCGSPPSRAGSRRQSAAAGGHRSGTARGVARARRRRAVRRSVPQDRRDAGRRHHRLCRALQIRRRARRIDGEPALRPARLHQGRGCHRRQGLRRRRDSRRGRGRRRAGGADRCLCVAAGLRRAAGESRTCSTRSRSGPGTMSACWR